MRMIRTRMCLLLMFTLLFGCGRQPAADESKEDPGREYEIIGPSIPSPETMLIFRIPNIGMEEGDAGRFSVGEYTARLRTSGSDHIQSQRIVNEEDSAWYYENLPGLTSIIADHYYQGLETIKTAIPGETVAYLAKEGTVTVYKCVSVYPDGQNLDGDLILSDGRVLQTSKGDGPLATYTCNDDVGISITVVFWEPFMTMSVITPGSYEAQ